MSGYPLTIERRPPNLGWPFLDVFGFSQEKDGLVREYSHTGLGGGMVDQFQPTLSFTGIFPLRNFFFGTDNRKVLNTLIVSPNMSQL